MKNKDFTTCPWRPPRRILYNCLCSPYYEQQKIVNKVVMDNIESNIRDIVTENKKSYAKMLKCRKEMHEYILQKTSFLNDDVKLSTRLFYMFNHIDSKLTCCGCGCEINRDFVALSQYEPKKICC